MSHRIRYLCNINVGSSSPLRDGSVYLAVEVKRKATIDAVEQLTRYLERLKENKTLMGDVWGVLAAQTIAPQARVLAESRGIGCVELDLDQLRGMEPSQATLF